MYGAAPLPLKTREFFFSINIFLNGIYGMSETSAPMTATLEKHKADYNLRACGMPLPGGEVIIENPDAEGNGEICFRARNNFMGYLKNEKATMETIDKKRYVHSGDLGRFDKPGNLLITGRLKEIIVTAGGENVAPILIEENIKRVLPFVSNAMVVGEGKKYLMCLLTLKTLSMPNELPVYQLAPEVIDY